jgi:hypothetical protein
MHIYKHVQSYIIIIIIIVIIIIIHQQVSVATVTIVRVYYNENRISTQIIVQKYIMKPPGVR